MSTPDTTATKIPLSDMKFRENFGTGKVELHVRKVVVFSSGEYRITATHAQRTYLLSDDELMEMYRDYKDDYDRQHE